VEVMVRQLLSRLSSKVKLSFVRGDRTGGRSDEMQNADRVMSALPFSCWIIYALPFPSRLFAACAVNAPLVKANETV